MDPLSVTASTLAIIQATSATYKVIQHLRGLPKEFIEVNRRLPLAEDTLRLARDQLQGQALDEPSKLAMQPLVTDCEERAKKLQDILEQVENGMKNTKDGSALDFYRRSLLRLGKAHRVETLMQGILRSLDALATNRLFKAATQSQVAQLQEAIDMLSKVRSSVPDSDFEGSGAILKQSIAAGGKGYQSHYSGQGQHINSGSGKQFNAQTMHFAPLSGGHMIMQSGSGTMNNYFAPFSEDKTRRDILQTLCTLSYLERKNRNADRVPGTCGWFVNHDLFKRWRESKTSSMLWVSAYPGCGKSVLARHLVDAVLQTEKSRTTCYFFFKDDFEDQRSAKGALSCILHQLFTQRKEFFSDKIVERFEDYKAYLTNSFDELWEVLVMAAQENNVGEIVCILDAFDECADEGERPKLANALRKFYNTDSETKNDANLKFLVTSRPYDTIGRGFRPLNIPGLPIIHLKGESDAEISKIAQEIDVYIEYKVSHIKDSRNLTQDEAQLLLQELKRNPNRTYLWVYLTLELVEGELRINKKRIRRTTSSLPQTVDDAYEKILTKSSDHKEARRLLHIVVAAARPLTLAEMELALALRPSVRSYKDLHDRLGSEESFCAYVMDLCGLFVTIIDLKIYLLHQTAKEFLVLREEPVPRDHHHRQIVWKSSLQPPESHRILCEICIWLLLFAEFETGPLAENLDGNVSHGLGNHLFLAYSATNWAFHFRASGIKDTAIIESLQKICDADSGRCLTWLRIHWAGTHMVFPRGFTTLMIASYFGLEQIVKLQLRMRDVDVDARDGTYMRSALSWASENGFDTIVELLIKGPKFSFKKAITKPSSLKGAEIDATDRDRRTPLSYAAWNGHMAIVRRLVKKGATVDSKDEIGGTPISYTLCTGQQDIANELMKGAQADSVDGIRRELLLSAVLQGHGVIVERLLGNTGVMEVVDHNGRTLLWLAVENEHLTIVKLLLEKGADVEVKDDSGRSPLSWAAENRGGAVIKVLLEKGADVEVKDNSGRGPLSRAASFGGEAVVKLLLETGTDVEAKDNSGRTPLSWAAANGREAVVELLWRMAPIFQPKITLVERRFHGPSRTGVIPLSCCYLDGCETTLHYGKWCLRGGVFVSNQTFPAVGRQTEGTRVYHCCCC